jgi:hypothetical protein
MRLQDFSRDDLLNYWYEKHYQDFTYNKYTKIFQKYFHSKLETKKFASTQNCLTLEIAANMGEHLIFVEDKSNYYMLYIYYMHQIYFFLYLIIVFSNNFLIKD